MPMPTEVHVSSGVIGLAHWCLSMPIITIYLVSYMDELFQHMLCHPSYTAHASLHMANSSRKHMPRLLAVMDTCWLKVIEMHTRHTLQICTPSRVLILCYQAKHLLSATVSFTSCKYFMPKIATVCESSQGSERNFSEDHMYAHLLLSRTHRSCRNFVNRIFEVHS